MKLSGSQALNQFVAAATLASWSSSSSSSTSNHNNFVSARIGNGLRAAPPRGSGFDATTAAASMNKHIAQQAAAVVAVMPNLQSIDEALKIVVLPIDDDDAEEVRQQQHQQQQSLPLRNMNRNGTTTTSSSSLLQNGTTTSSSTEEDNTDEHEHEHELDFGVLKNPAAPASVPSLHTDNRRHEKTTTASTSTSTSTSTLTSTSLEEEEEAFAAAAATASTCMMGFDKDRLLPADAYLQKQLDSGRSAFSRILFDEASSTIFCNQENDADEDIGTTVHHTYGCASMHFRGCQTVKCNGKESCIDATIEDAITIECEGYESCRDARLDADTVDCGGESACMGATIGTPNSFVSTLDCHSGESACAYATTHGVGSVFCTGPLSCYGAELRGVVSSVTCQGVPHPHLYYMPTCGGGDSGIIEAAHHASIDVVCDGDFACIGNGPNDKDRPEHFPIDVGDHGHLTCGGSMLGNHDGFTFVCKHIDILLGNNGNSNKGGCSGYECHEPAFAHVDHDASHSISDRELRTCQHIVSLGESCGKSSESEDEENENDEEDMEGDEEDEENEDDIGGDDDEEEDEEEEEYGEDNDESTKDER